MARGAIALDLITPKIALSKIKKTLAESMCVFIEILCICLLFHQTTAILLIWDSTAADPEGIQGVA